MPLFAVDKKCLPIKTHYFLYNAGLAPLIIFATTIAKQIGFSAVTAGVIFTVLPIVGFITKILFSALADKHKSRKLTLFITVLVCLLCSFSMVFVNTSYPAKQVYLLCHRKSYISTCNNYIPHSQIEKWMKVDRERSIKCEMQCQTMSKLTEELCSSWNVDKFCENSAKMNRSTSANFTFTATLPNEHVQKLEKCLYAQVTSAQFDSSGPEIQPYCGDRVNTSCIVKCDNTRFMEIIGNDEMGLWRDMTNAKFWIFFLILLINWSCMSLGNSLSDTLCFEVLENEPEKFGHQRMFGALGWGLMALGSGYLVDWYSKFEVDKDYSILFFVVCLIYATDLVAVYSLNVTHKVLSITIYKDVKILFANYRTIVFTFWCIFTGFLMGVSWYFLFWHLEDISDMKDLQWSKTIQGLDTLFTTVFGEMIFFMISGWIIKSLGYVNTMSVVLVACTVRMFLYAMLKSPLWVLPVELISGFTFSMCYVIIASYSSFITIPGTESTVQSLFGAMFDGLGVALGSLIGGVVYSAYKGAVLFVSLGCVSAVAVLLHVFIQFKHQESLVYDSKNSKVTGARYAPPNDAINMLHD